VADLPALAEDIARSSPYERHPLESHDGATRHEQLPGAAQRYVKAQAAIEHAVLSRPDRAAKRRSGDDTAFVSALPRAS
jgi:hypothetical protein